MLGELELLSVVLGVSVLEGGVLGRGDSGALNGKQERLIVRLCSFFVGEARTD